MIKKTITYKDFDGNTLVEDFYFHLSKPELVKLKVEKDGGFEAIIKEISATSNEELVFELFERVISMSLGRRSENGKSFEKKPEYVTEFLGSNAWEVLFMEMMTGADAAAFMNGILPGEMVKEIAEKMETADLPVQRDPTDKEMTEMSQEEFDKLFGTNPAKWSLEVMQAAFKRKQAITI